MNSVCNLFLLVGLLLSLPSTSSLQRLAHTTPTPIPSQRAVAVALAKPTAVPKPPLQWDTARLLDGVVASFGAGVSVYALTALNGMTPITLYAPPLAASSILIFAGSTPPPLANILLGTGGAAVAAVAVSYIPDANIDLARALAVVLSLGWFKASNRFFPPAAALAVLVFDSPQLGELGWTYVPFPCLAGNAFLYCAAIGLASIRSMLRQEICRRGLVEGLAERDTEDLRREFTRFDTSGDGMIDLVELQVRTAAGRENGRFACGWKVTRMRGGDTRGELAHHPLSQCNSSAGGHALSDRRRPALGGRRGVHPDP